MSYTALYRKWRPAGFDDVKGQDHIVTALKNQILSGRIGHAYLFTGTRGTGKTSVAKIFARAVNCEHPSGGSPCGTCASCRAIAAGASLNVSEIDAASNNGVENIREILDEVQYSPAEGKYRVYIIDEAHMLSNGAFNALLKTLEEPPSYVIFILATTEVNRIPVTVLSRCQRYDFRRIESGTIADRLAEMALSEHIDVTDQALRYIARRGDGSMRDSISLFDQCIAFFYGEQLTYDKVLDVLGAVDTEIYRAFFADLQNGDAAACIRTVDRLLLEGRELSQFVSDLIWYLRNLLLAMTSDVTADTLDISEENLARLREQASGTDMNRLMRYIRVLSELSGQMRFSPSRRVLLETALIRLTHPEMEASADAVMQRMDTLEEQLRRGTFPVYAAAGAPAPLPVADAPQTPSPAPREDSGAARSPERIVVLPQATLEDFRRIQDSWSQILRGVGGAARAIFSGSRPEYAGNGGICLVFTEPIAYEAALQGPDKLAALHKFVADNYRLDAVFTARLAPKDEPPAEYLTKEELSAKFNIDIIFENS